MKNEKRKLINQLKKLKVNDRVEVEWLDHFTEPGWQRGEYINKQELLLCKSAGYFVGANKESMKIGASVDPYSKYNDVTHIICSCIKSVRKLK